VSNGRDSMVDLIAFASLPSKSIKPSLICRLEYQISTITAPFRAIIVYKVSVSIRMPTASRPKSLFQTPNEDIINILKGVGGPMCTRHTHGARLYRESTTNAIDEEGVL